jgi:branched-chain amino acid transport system substrate-binding protein
MFQIDGIQVAGEASDYFVFTYPYLTYRTPEECNIPIMREYLDLTYAEYGNIPVTDCAYRAWDSVMVLQEAVRLAGSTETDAVKNAIPRITNFEGLGGTFDYSAGDREGLHSFNRFIIIDQNYVLFDEWMKNGGYDKYKNEVGA